MGNVIDAAAALQKQKEAERKQQEADQLALIEPLARAASLAAELAELHARARKARKDAPSGLHAELDAVVSATGGAAAAAADTQTRAWNAAKAGGWSARDLRAIGLKPGRVKPAAAAEAAAGPAPSNEDQARAVSA
ncbi:hypothetical protein BS329_38575 [Amycolatopsis coloradensis]|uniref:Uncharacterized protein n=1 Tax=Amycolatopsis coloradensis TaxID=76021 RepID=A0A1R0KEM4_9PSEU|nr:hypothetical protein [Amycolatopsis coloradensis]OLZ43565.1 hypothetical protein BS329_38575 [Amycolatopsis coloradensis]